MPRTGQIVVAVGLTAAWLGLAIWGEGGWRAFVSHSVLLAVAIQPGHELVTSGCSA